MATTKKITIVVNRSAVTGRFVTESYAAKHQRTTETERIKINKPVSK